jgi:hypothetical protein
MAKLFISYASNDREFAEKLKVELESLGHFPWWFDEGVGLGQKWQEAILDQLKKVDALIILVSEASMHSNWVNHELGAALAYSEERGSPAIIPVVLDQTPLSIPLSRYLAVFVGEKPVSIIASQISSALESQVGRQKARAEEQREIQKKVEVSAADFIQKSLGELAERERSYRRLAYFWYSIAYATLVSSAAFGVWRALVSPPATKDWVSLASLAISGVIVLGLLIALAKYAFTLGKSFMVEALRNADRRHAISFGEFFLRAYGSSADWKDVKEAFQDWNIDKGSHFIGQTGVEFDPQVLTVAVELAKIMADKLPNGSKKA